MRSYWFARRWGWISVILLAVAVATPCQADDIGVRDTCRFTSGTWIISGDQESVFSVELWGWNDDTLIIGANLPFKVSFDTTGFDPVEWNVHMDSVEYNPNLYLHFWVSTADSFIVVDTFIYEPNLGNEVQMYRRSLLDCDRQRSDDCFGYNGFNLGIYNMFPVDPIFEPGVSTKIGDLYLRITDPGRLPDSFHIEIDSMLFPPAGTFKYSPMFSPEGGHAPDFTKSVITVIQVPFACGDVDDAGGVVIDDAIYLINFIFSGGPPPGLYGSGDVDCSGGVDIDDVVWLIVYIFSGGNAPCDIDGDGEPDC